MMSILLQCGSDIVSSSPSLVGLQNKIVDLPGIRAFIRSTSYYPPGDEIYVEQVDKLIQNNIALHLFFCMLSQHSSISRVFEF